MRRARSRHGFGSAFARCRPESWWTVLATEITARNIRNRDAFWMAPTSVETRLVVSDITGGEVQEIEASKLELQMM